MVCTIQRIADASVHSTGNRNVTFAKWGSSAVAIECGRRSCRSRKRDQLDHSAAVQRKLENAFVLHNLADGRCTSLNKSRIRFHFDLLANLANLQDDVHARAAANLQSNTRLH